MWFSCNFKMVPLSRTESRIPHPPCLREEMFTTRMGDGVGPPQLMSCCHLLGADTLSPTPSPCQNLPHQVRGCLGNQQCALSHPHGTALCKNQTIFQVYFSEALCVSNYFYPRNPNPAASVLTLPEMFPSSHWSCFLVPFHSQLSHASSQEPPVTHII